MILVLSMMVVGILRNIKKPEELEKKLLNFFIMLTMNKVVLNLQDLKTTNERKKNYV